MTWSPDHTLRGRRRRRRRRPTSRSTAASRRRPPRPPPARPGISRRKFLIGGAVAVAAVGVAAFLAATSGGGHGAAAVGSGGTAPRPADGAAVGDRRQRRARRVPATRHRRAPLRELDRLHRHRPRTASYPTLQKFAGRDRASGHLPRGHQRQRGVLRGEPVRPARRRPADRVGHRGPDRLDDRPARPARLARGHRHGQPRRTSWRTWRRSYVGPLVRPGHEVRRAMAVRA